MHSVRQDRLHDVPHAQLAQVRVRLCVWRPDQPQKRWEEGKLTCPQPTKMMGCPVT